jgi:hypothetical protein
MIISAPLAPSVLPPSTPDVPPHYSLWIALGRPSEPSIGASEAAWLGLSKSLTIHNR